MILVRTPARDYLFENEKDATRFCIDRPDAIIVEPTTKYVRPKAKFFDGLESVFQTRNPWAAPLIGTKARPR